MNIHQHAPPGASGGHTALTRLLEADWSRGVPAGYLEALDRLRKLRGEFEEQIAAAIDGLDILDMTITDLEDDGEAGKPTTLDRMLARDSEDSEPSLGASEAVTCSDGPATLVRKARRNRSCKPLNENGKVASGALKPACGLARSIDRSCDQSDWGGFVHHGEQDAELDAADDEPSLGAIERHPVVGFYAGMFIDPRSSQVHWATDEIGDGISSDDGEQDAGDEPEEENEHGGNVEDQGEPSLGAPELVLRADQSPVGAVAGDQTEAWSIPSASETGTDCEACDEGQEGDGDSDFESDEGHLPGSGCNDGTRLPSFIDASKPNHGRPFADPNKMPARYAMVGEGQCMSPAVRDGETLIFVRDATILMRDLVAIYLDPAKVRAGDYQTIVKRFMGYGACATGEGIIVEWDNPPTRAMIPNDHILAVHRCVGTLPDDALRHIVSASEVAYV